jgi:hypothetical protein
MLLMTKSHHQFDDNSAALGFPPGKLKEFTEVIFQHYKIFHGQVSTNNGICSFSDMNECE